MNVVDEQAPPARTLPGGTVPRISGKYLSLTSYKRDGTPVATPVWFVEDDAQLLVTTGATTAKVRRIRRNPDVTVASCNARGSLKGDPVKARARLLPASEHAGVERLMARKYRIDRVLILPIYRLGMRLTGHGSDVTGAEAILAITPVAPGPPSGLGDVEQLDRLPAGEDVGQHR